MGLAIVLLLYRNRRSIAVDEFDLMKAERRRMWILENAFSSR